MQTPTEGTKEMCFVATKWALRQEVSPLAKLILALLCDHADPETLTCWPSIDCLKQQSGMSRRSVINQISVLEAAGLIKRKIKKGSGNFYLIAVQDMHQCTSDTSASDAPELVHLVHPKELVKELIPPPISSPAKPKPKQKTKSTQSGRTSIPADWDPREGSSEIEYARAKGLSTEEIRDLKEEFRDWHLERTDRANGQYKDWGRRWQQFVRSEARKKRERKSQTQTEQRSFGL